MAKTRLLSFILAVVMVLTFTVPAFAQEVMPLTELIEVSREADSQEAVPDTQEANADKLEAPPADSSYTSSQNEGFGMDEEPDNATETELPLGISSNPNAWLDAAIARSGIRPFASAGDTATITYSTININPYNVTVPGVGNAYGSVVFKMRTSGGDDAFCTQIWKLVDNGTYVAGGLESGNSRVNQILANYSKSSKGSSYYVAAQILIWEALYGDIGLYSQVIAGTSHVSAYNSLKNGSESGSGYLVWVSGTGGQEVVTIGDGGIPEEPDPDPDPNPEPEPENPNTHTEVTTETSTRTEIRSGTEYEYSDALGQITVCKRDDEGNSLDGAIFRIDIEFANGQRGGTSAFEVYNGSRLFTWTHPRDDHDPAKVTVTEIYCPPGYIMDSTPQTAIVHPTYTRITKVTTHTITITTTTTTTTVIDIDTGEVLAESSASADAETELNPPVIQEYTDFVAGDRETTLTFVNQQQSAELIIFKYRSGTGVPLEGAQFEVSYVDPGVHSGRWTVTTGPDGKAVIALPKPGAILIHEVSPPAHYVITAAGPDTTVTIRAGESKQVDIPNDPYTAVEVTKIDSVTGAKLAGATISLKHITSGMEYRQVTDGGGIALFENVEPGSYYAEEIIAPDRYVLNTTRYPVELRSHETAAVTIPDDPYTGIEVTKVDANNGQKLAGAFIRIKHISSGQEYTGETGADGIIYFGLIPPGNYYVEEIQAPFGYVLNDTRFPLELKTGELSTLTLPNYRKDGLYIRKVDENGKPLAGAVFELRRSSGQMLIRETTDENGLIYRGYLTTDTYVVEEIQAPTGYLLDKNNPQSIYIDETDDNKEYTLTFVNLQKPSIQITKVDENDPSKRLQGAVFRISEQGGTKTWDVATGFDGTALLENLEPGITYIVEEITAPNGYVNSGYREAIVLEESRVHTITVTNSTSPKLRIRKIDADTGEGLAGAVLRITKDGGAAFQDVTTGAGGVIVVPDLFPGWYMVTERQAPSGYLLDETPQYIEVKAGVDTELVIQNRRKPSLKIIKLDSVTKQPLQYVTFSIAYKNGKTIGEFTTDANGEILLEDIQPGLVVITETKGRKGYIIADASKELLVEHGKLAVMEFLNQPKLPLLIHKVDAKTGEPLAGAKFSVSKVDGVYVGEFETGRNGFITVTGLEPGFYVVKEVKSPLGYILSDTPKTVELKLDQPAQVEFENQPLNGLHLLKVDSKTGAPLAGAKFSLHRKIGILVGNYTTNTHGEIVIDGLEPGWFTITETAAPEGYLLDNTPRDVELMWGQFAAVEFANRRLSPIEIKKVDADTGAPLSGALFRVTTTEGTLIGEFTTSVDGFINVPDLEPGSYIIYELRAPDGYSLDNTPKTVVVKADATTLVEFTNKALPGVQVRKVDAVTGQPLAGAKFRVTKMNGELIGDYVTNQAGFFALSELEAGWYTIYETAAPAGYITDSTPQNVELKPNKTAVVEFQNKPLAGLQIKKVDEVTRLPLAGVTFTVGQLDGKRLGSFTTDDNGLIFIPDLREGWLVVTETGTVPGYKLDSAPRNVEIKSGVLNLLEIANMPYPYLQIKKVDGDTGKVLAGVKFKIYDKNTRELGEFSTNEVGIVKLTGMEPGTYFVRESQALEGYVLDETLREVTLYAGKTTVINVKNTPLATLRLKKVDAETGKPLAGAKFLLRDVKNNILGEYVSDASGLIALPSSLPAGKYTAEEITAPGGYVLLEAPVSIELKAGANTEIVVENQPVRGKIQIVKKSTDTNSITGKKAGTALAGAVFEIVSEKLELVDTITTNERGIVESADLPLGRYAVREVKAPQHYLQDDSVFYADVKLHGDVVRFEVLNHSADLEVTVEKRGNVEALPGDVIRYDFSHIANASNCELEDFFWHDQLPVDAVRLEKLVTGTWSQKLKYKVVYRTNLKTEYRTWEGGLSSTQNHELDVMDLRLAASEYVTDFKLEFGTVEAGFHETEAPYILIKVVDDLPYGHRFVNKTDVGGHSGSEYATAQDSWVTVVFAPSKPLPRTGR